MIVAGIKIGRELRRSLCEASEEGRPAPMANANTHVAPTVGQRRSETGNKGLCYWFPQASHSMKHDRPKVNASEWGQWTVEHARSIIAFSLF
jgi:hypothetical protein